jgi:hypothetical protein
MLQWPYTHVASVCFQVFQTYVSSASSGCCKSRSGCCIYMHVAKYVFKCLRCFVCMLQVFHLDVAYVLQWLHTCFSSVSDVSCKCFSGFGCMLQVFHLGVAKVGLAHTAMGPTYCSCSGAMHAHVKWRGVTPKF